MEFRRLAILNLIVFLFCGFLHGSDIENDSIKINQKQHYDLISEDETDSINYYEEVLIYSMDMIELVEDYRDRLNAEQVLDSIFCDKIINNILKIKEYIGFEIDSKDGKILSKKEHIEELKIERYRVAKYFLIAIAVLAIGLLILLYSRYKILLKAKMVMAENEDKITQVNLELKKTNSALTEHKEKLEKLNNELIKANEILANSEETLKTVNAGKDKFFSVISHDLRNPFASIASFSRIIKRDIDNLSKEELKELAKELDKSIIKINNLLDNLLVWSKSQSGKTIFRPGYINLFNVIEDSIELLEGLIKEKEIDLNLKVKDNIVAYCDKNMFDTILRNLITNAVKFSKPGGTITLSAEKSDSFIHISVIDNGVGIPEENKEKILNHEIFFSTYGTNDEKGSGLGLHITKEFVEKQGGQITFESTEGKGTTFTFTIPLEEK